MSTIVRSHTNAKSNEKNSDRLSHSSLVSDNMAALQHHRRLISPQATLCSFLASELSNDASRIPAATESTVSYREISARQISRSRARRNTLLVCRSTDKRLRREIYGGLSRERFACILLFIYFISLRRRAKSAKSISPIKSLVKANIIAIKYAT